MANSKISELPLATSLQDGDSLVVVNESATKRTTISDLGATFSASNPNFKQPYVLGEDLSAGDVVKFEADDSVKKVFGGKFKFTEGATVLFQESIEISSSKYLFIYVIQDFALRTPVGYAVVGNVVDNSVTYDTAVSFSTGIGEVAGAALLDTDKVLVVYQEDAPAYAHILDISGNTVTSGNRLAMADGYKPQSVGVTDTNKVLVAGVEDTNLRTVYEAQISGANISFSTSATYFDQTSKASAICNLAPQKALLVYSDDATSKISSVVVDTSSGTPVLGTSVVAADSFSAVVLDAEKVENNKAVMAWSSDIDGDAQIEIATVVNSDITLGGSPFQIDPFAHTDIKMRTLDTSTVVVVYDNYLSRGADSFILDINGTTLTRRGTVRNFSSGVLVDNLSISALGTDKFIVSFIDSRIAGSARIGHLEPNAICYETRFEFIGVLEEDGLEGETKNVILSGLYTESGPLTAGKYIVSSSGRLELDDGTDFDAPLAGKAVSTTSILITN